MNLLQYIIKCYCSVVLPRGAVGWPTQVEFSEKTIVLYLKNVLVFKRYKRVEYNMDIMLQAARFIAMISTLIARR